MSLTDKAIQVYDAGLPNPRWREGSVDDDTVEITDGRVLQVKQVPDTKVLMQALAGATYDTLREWVNATASVGYVEGGEITDNGDGTVAVAAGKGILRTTDSDIGETVMFDWSADSSVALTNNTLNYITVSYNGGSPVIGVETNFDDLTFTTQFVVGIVYREGTDLYILRAGNHIPNDNTDNCVRLYLRGGEWKSGAETSETGTRQLAITAGVFHLGETRIDTNAVDTSVTDFAGYYYRDGVGGWNTVSPATGQIDNTHYDDGSGTLATLNPNRYGVHWVYLLFDGHVAVIFGQGNYTLAQAGEAQPPGSRPGIINSFGVLAAKVIVKNGASSLYDVIPAFGQKFTPTEVSDHGNLAGLGDDDHTQYLRADGSRAMSDDLNMGANAITNVGNVDGRDVSVDGTKLDGIEAGAEENDLAVVASGDNESITTYKSITGLSANKHYRLYWSGWLNNGGNTADNKFYLRFNNDSTAGHYRGYRRAQGSAGIADWSDTSRLEFARTAYNKDTYFEFVVDIFTGDAGSYFATGSIKAAGVTWDNASDNRLYVWDSGGVLLDTVAAAISSIQFGISVTGAEVK